MGGVTAHAAGHGLRRVSAAAFGSMCGWLLGAVARRLSTRTGVSDAEAYGALPGDDLIAHPMVEWTRGITVYTAPERLWPWLVQMGYGRGGWYTPQWVDLFANRWGVRPEDSVPCERRPVASRIPACCRRGHCLRWAGLCVLTFASNAWIHHTHW